MTDFVTARPRRSWLFTPASRPERFAKAALSGADVLILDLEDAVHPDGKDDARRTALAFLGQPAATRPIPTALRINGLTTRNGLADLLAIAQSPVNLEILVLPKTESADVVRLADKIVSEAGLSCALVPLIESARGVAKAGEIAAASPRIDALFVGAADLAADLGSDTSWEPLQTARSQVIMAAAQAGIGVIDSPFFALDDAEGLDMEIRRSVAFGFTAKAAIHPKQVDAINRALTPSTGDIADARAILAENAKGVGVMNGRMVDEAVARKARRILATAGQPLS